MEKLNRLQMFDKFADSKLRLQILNNLQINPQILQIRKPVLTYTCILYSGTLHWLGLIARSGALSGL